MGIGIRTLLARLGPLRAPPEPLALRLMQRAPNNWDARSTELLQLDGNRINVLDEQRVIRIRGILQRCLDVKVRGCGIKPAPPGLRSRIIEPDRRTPMPYKAHDAALFVMCDGVVDIDGAGAP